MKFIFLNGFRRFAADEKAGALHIIRGKGTVMKIDDRLLSQALTNVNQRFVEELPQSVDVHAFSNRFERKMNRLIVTDKKYGGHIWQERLVRYGARLAVLVMCLVTVNFVSVRAFNLNLWQVVMTKTDEFVQVNFRRQNEPKVAEDTSGTNESKVQKSTSAAEALAPFVRMKIINIPDGYTEQEYYSDDSMTVQQLASDKGTITYTESLITETVDVNIASGEQETGTVEDKTVFYVMGEESITAFFNDEKFYHIVQVQGENADKKFANQIIEGLEAQ